MSCIWNLTFTFGLRKTVLKDWEIYDHLLLHGLDHAGGHPPAISGTRPHPARRLRLQRRRFGRQLRGSGFSRQLWWSQRRIGAKIGRFLTKDLWRIFHGFRRIFCNGNGFGGDFGTVGLTRRKGCVHLAQVQGAGPWLLRTHLNDDLYLNFFFW